MEVIIIGNNQEIVRPSEYGVFKLTIGDEEILFEEVGVFWNKVPPIAKHGHWLYRPYYSGYEWHIHAKRLEVKTDEQIAAEESVAKAKEALKAAENALKMVRGQKK